MSDDQDGGPFRTNAGPPAVPARTSSAAVVSPISVIAGWLLLGLALDASQALGIGGALLLLVGGVAGVLGLIETAPRGPDGDAPPDELERTPPRGRGLAKLGLVFLLTPLALGCIGFGLLLLTCGGH